MLGALLRMAYGAAVQEYTRWLAGSPYSGIQPAHASAIQPLWQRPEGARLTELARIARITKQSMAALVDALEEGGYVERIDDPDDGRASRVRLTARGRRFARDARAFARDFERGVARRIGKQRVDDLRDALELLVASSKAGA